MKSLRSILYNLEDTDGILNGIIDILLKMGITEPQKEKDQPSPSPDLFPQLIKISGDLHHKSLRVLNALQELNEEPKKAETKWEDHEVSGIKEHGGHSF